MEYHRNIIMYGLFSILQNIKALLIIFIGFLKLACFRKNISNFTECIDIIRMLVTHSFFDNFNTLFITLEGFCIIGLFLMKISKIAKCYGIINMWSSHNFLCNSKTLSMVQNSPLIFTHLWFYVPNLAEDLPSEKMLSSQNILSNFMTLFIFLKGFIVISISLISNPQIIEDCSIWRMIIAFSSYLNIKANFILFDSLFIFPRTLMDNPNVIEYCCVAPMLFSYKFLSNFNTFLQVILRFFIVSHGPMNIPNMTECWSTIKIINLSNRKTILEALKRLFILTFKKVTPAHFRQDFCFTSFIWHMTVNPSIGLLSEIDLFFDTDWINLIAHASSTLSNTQALLQGNHFGLKMHHPGSRLQLKNHRLSIELGRHIFAQKRSIVLLASFCVESQPGFHIVGKQIPTYLPRSYLPRSFQPSRL